MAIKNIKAKTALRPRYETNGDLQASFQEVISTTAEILSMYNQYIVPLLASLPAGGRNVLASERSATINPTANGLDGSQVFMDQAASPSDARLHNSVRPYTIKEVVEALSDGLTSRLSVLERVVNALAPQNGVDATVTDELRNMILQLAGDTISDGTVAQGGTQPIGYFGAAPAKQPTHSLNEREVALRNMVGVEALAQNETSVLTLLAGTTHIVAATDIIDALKALDAAIAAAAPAVTLQTAYDNGPTIVCAAGVPVSVSNTTADPRAFELDGYVQFRSAGADAVALLGRDNGGLSEMVFTSASAPLLTENQFMRALRDGPDMGTYDLGVVSDARASSFLSTVNIGRRSLGAGFGPFMKIECLDTAAILSTVFDTEENFLLKTTKEYRLEASAGHETYASSSTVTGAGTYELSLEDAWLWQKADWSNSLLVQEGASVFGEFKKGSHGNSFFGFIGGALSNGQWNAGAFGAQSWAGAKKNGVSHGSAPVAGERYINNTVKCLGNYDVSPNLSGPRTAADVNHEFNTDHQLCTWSSGTSIFHVEFLNSLPISTYVVQSQAYAAGQLYMCRLVNQTTTGMDVEILRWDGAGWSPTTGSDPDLKLHFTVI